MRECVVCGSECLWPIICSPCLNAGGCFAQVRDPVELDALNSTWLRRVNPLSYANSTVVYPTPSPGASPSVVPTPNRGVYALPLRD